MNTTWHKLIRIAMETDMPDFDCEVECVVSDSTEKAEITTITFPGVNVIDVFIRAKEAGLIDLPELEYFVETLREVERK